MRRIRTTVGGACAAAIVRIAVVHGAVRWTIRAGYEERAPVWLNGVFAGLFTVAVLTGLMTGMVQGTYVGVRKALDPLHPSAFNQTMDAPWMSPLGETVFFATLACVLFLLLGVWRKPVSLRAVAEDYTAADSAPLPGLCSHPAGKPDDPVAAGPRVSVVWRNLHFNLKGDGNQQPFDRSVDPFGSADRSGDPGTFHILERMRGAAQGLSLLQDKKPNE